ncbi:MAG: TerB N-terminal domain-containing protein, partial [Lachnospiraceae bacterium]
MTDLFSWNGWGLSVSESAGATIVLGQRPDKDSPEIVYGETALPFANENRPEPSGRSERIRQMRRLFVYGREDAKTRAENFYRQAKYMEDYEDDAPWSGSFTAYYPTYQDLTVSQLRGYFSWRTKARRGEFSPIPTSAAYLYIYELFNGIGAASPKETLEKLREFEEGFLDAGLGDARMQTNVRRWMFEYAVLQDLPPVEVLKYADPAQTEMDNALAALSGAEDDEKIVRALFLFGGKKYEKSPAFADERGKQLLAEIWRKTIKDFAPGGKPCFEACFGRQIFFRWEPLSNAIYHYETQPYAAERIYILNKCRSFLCRGGVWQMYAYDKVFFHLHFVKELLHAADARLRRYLGTGKNLTEKPEEAWAQPYISAVLEEDRKGREEAAKPKIRIDLSGLERIRKDALVTQSSLLVEEEPAPELL